MSDTDKPDPDCDEREYRFLKKLFGDIETESPEEAAEMARIENLSDEQIRLEIGAANVDGAKEQWSVDRLMARVERILQEAAKARSGSGEKK